MRLPVEGGGEGHSTCYSPESRTQIEACVVKSALGIGDCPVSDREELQYFAPWHMADYRTCLAVGCGDGTQDRGSSVRPILRSERDLRKYYCFISYLQSFTHNLGWRRQHEAS